MKIRTLIYVSIPVLLVLALGVAFLFMLGGSNDSHRVAAAQQSLELMLVEAGQDRSDDEPYRTFLHGYRSDAIRNALSRIKSGSPMGEPYLYAAVFVPGEDGGISLSWLESGFHTSGFYVLTDGDMLGNFQVFDWTSKRKNWYAPTIDRNESISIKFGDGDQTVPTSQAKAIPLKASDLDHKLQVGLILDNGKLLSPIEAYVLRK